MGQPVTFRGYCNFDELAYTWSFNGEPLPIYDTKQEYLRENPTKSIPFVQPEFDSKSNCYSLKADRIAKEHEGTYELFLTNKKGEVAKTAGELTVHRPAPKFVKKLSPVYTPEDEKVKFECHLDDPERAVTWSHKDQNDKPTNISNRKFKVSNEDGLHKLEFVATAALQGTVTCTMDDSDFTKWGINKNHVELSTTGNFFKA